MFTDSGYCQWNPWNNLAWKFNRSAALQEIPCILYNLTFSYRIHNSLAPIPVLNQIKPVNALPQNFLNVYFIFPSVPRSSKWFLSLILPYQNHLYATSTPCLTHAPPIAIFFTWIHEIYLICSTDYLVKIHARFVHKLMWYKKSATCLAKLVLRYI